MHIVVISGSARIGRQTPKVASAIITELQSREQVESVSLVDVEDYNFPIMQERRGRNPNPPERLEECGALLESADGIIIASPEYNGGMSGALKNTMDYFYGEYRKKPFGIAMVSGGARGGIRAAQDIQKYVLALQGYPMPYMLLVANVRSTVSDDGTITDDKLRDNLVRFVDEHIWFTEAIIERKRKDS